MAAFKIQVRWNLKTGELPQILRSGEAAGSGDPRQAQAANVGWFVGRVQLKSEKALPDLEKVVVPPG